MAKMVSYKEFISETIAQFVRRLIDNSVLPTGSWKPIKKIATDQRLVERIHDGGTSTMGAPITAGFNRPLSYWIINLPVSHFRLVQSLLFKLWSVSVSPRGSSNGSCWAKRYDCNNRRALARHGKDLEVKVELLTFQLVTGTLGPKYNGVVLSPL